jgi:hypothetical protein
MFHLLYPARNLAIYVWSKDHEVAFLNWKYIYQSIFTQKNLINTIKIFINHLLISKYFKISKENQNQSNPKNQSGTRSHFLDMFIGKIHSSSCYWIKLIDIKFDYFYCWYQDNQSFSLSFIVFWQFFLASL